MSSTRLQRQSRLTSCKSWLALALMLVAGLASRPISAEIEIQINGIDGVLRRNVLAFLSLERYKSRDDLDEALIERLQERAEREAADALRPLGYYAATVGTEIEKIGPNRWRARLNIDPGAPVVLRQVNLRVTGEGESHPAFRELLGNPPLRPGERLDHSLYDATKATLRRNAATLGFLEAQIKASELRVDPTQQAADATLWLDTGPRYSFGTTRIEQELLDENLLRRYLRYQEGSAYDATQTLRTQFALDDSLYFASVEVLAGEPDTDAKTIPIEIRTEPNRRNRYSIGLGFATDTEARGSLAWENRRINRRGHRLRSEVKAARIEQSVEARYLVPIGDPALERLNFEWRYARDEVGDLDTRTTRFQPAITQVRGEWQRVTSVSFDRINTIIRGRDFRERSNEATTLAIPAISFASIPRGYLGEALFSRPLYAELRGSTEAFGAADDFLQLRLEAEKVLPIAPGWNSFLRAQFGTTWVSSTDRLPGTERFFAGGDRSVRGFGYTELSPRDEFGAKVGGRHLLAGTAELIRDLPRNFSLAVFFDIGNAVDDFDEPLQYSAGIGVRFRLPVVTLGIDLAQPLTNPACRASRPDPRCKLEPGFTDRSGPRLHINFLPKL